MSEGADPDREIAQELRLRGDPPRVARLSRRAIVLLSGAACAALVAVIATSLHGGRRDAADGTPRPDPTPVAPPQQVAELPKDYASLPPGTPKLGPPLPGDLGRPILEGSAGASASSGLGAGTTSAPADPATQQARTMAQQARASRLVVATAATPTATGAAEAVDLPKRAPSQLAPESSSDAVANETSPYRLLAGSVIRAALITGLRSDLPGPVTAVVTADVFDSVRGRWTLIPQGSRLIGTYDSHIGFGEDRVQVTWSRLMLPDGRSLNLDNMQATDPEGYVGLADRVDHHWRGLMGASLISTLLGAGSQLGVGSSDSAWVQALHMGAAQSTNQVGQQIVGKTLGVAPSVTIRPGFEFRVLVTKDLNLEPWSP
jgi:type IV secretory pathway VirB10-like protein